MNREVQVRNPYPGAARGREGGPSSYRMIMVKVISDDLLAAYKAANEIGLIKKNSLREDGKWVVLTKAEPEMEALFDIISDRYGVEIVSGRKVSK
jgi:hypothetical protein